MPEPTGKEVLESLLAVLEGVVLPVEVEGEQGLPPDVPCQVPLCNKSGIFRCSLGWRYCADHVGRHGEWSRPHLFILDAKARRTEILEARARVRQRLEAAKREETS